MQEYLQLLSLSDLEAIHAATVQVLEDVGVWIGSQEALALFDKAGARVDFKSGRVRIPEALLQHALSTGPSSFTLHGRGQQADVCLGDGKTYFHHVGGSFKVFDLDLHAARDTTKSDLERIIVLIDAIPNIHLCRPVYVGEVLPQLRDVYTAYKMLLGTDKPYVLTGFSPASLEFLIQLAAAVVGGLNELCEKPIISVSLSPESPLRYADATIDMLIKVARYGLPIDICSCPVAGGTSPVTLAGTLVQQNAEFLAGVVLARIVNPCSPVKYTTRPIPMDMGTGASVFGAIELGKMSAAVVQLGKFYKIPVDVYGLGTSSKTLDEQTAFEKSLNALLPALLKPDVLSGAGSLEDSRTFSLEQLLIDSEILGMVAAAVKGIEVSPAMLAVDVIASVGPWGQFLSHPHTLKNYRGEYYHPFLCERRSRETWESTGKNTIVDKAKAKVGEILQKHGPLREDTPYRDEFDRILAEAERVLMAARS